MIAITGIDHLVLRCSDVVAMRQFYCQVLHCTVERETAIGLTQLRAGSALIDLLDVNSKLGRAGGPAPSAGSNNMDHFCLQLEAVSEQALGEYLRENNIEFAGFEQRYGAGGLGPSVYIHDPAGNIVELKL